MVVCARSIRHADTVHGFRGRVAGTAGRLGGGLPQNVSAIDDERRSGHIARSITPSQIEGEEDFVRWAEAAMESRIWFRINGLRFLLLLSPTDWIS
jgi:hypothetical protein